MYVRDTLAPALAPAPRGRQLGARRMPSREAPPRLVAHGGRVMPAAAHRGPAPVNRGGAFHPQGRALPRGVSIRRASATLGDSDSATDQGLGWGWHPFHGWSIKKLGKGITKLGHNIGKVVTSKPFQLVEGGALALTGVGLPAAAAIMGASKGVGNLIKPGGNLKHFATGLAQGAVEGVAAHEAGTVARGATRLVRRKFFAPPSPASSPAALTPSITPPAGLVQTTPLAPPVATLPHPSVIGAAIDTAGTAAATGAAILTRRASSATDAGTDAMAGATAPAQTVSDATAQNTAPASAGSSSSSSSSSSSAPSSAPDYSGGGASDSSNGDVIDSSTPQLTADAGAADAAQGAGMSKGKALAIGAGVAALAVGAIHFAHKPGGRR